MRPVPILFVGDNPALSSGLARITRDLATRVAAMPEFRVGVFGRGGTASSKLPFAQYPFDEAYGWGAELFESAWNDFAGIEKGVVFTIWDASRLTWFANPQMGGPLEHFLKSGRFQRWGYFPVDSIGVGDKLTGMSAAAVKRFDRVLAYSIFGKQVLENSIGRPVDWIPHGFEPRMFEPREKAAGRAILRLPDDVPLVGCVMANQARKDWGTAFAAIARVKETIPTIKLWAHTDVLNRHWDLRALAADFGLTNTVRITTEEFSSEQLSYLYSACDITILPSLGEGHGYSITESLACGVPVVHVAYAAGQEQIPVRDWLVDSTEYRLEGPWNCLRPILNPGAWGDKILHVLSETAGGFYRDECTRAVSHLMWPNLWPTFQRWFLEGIRK